MAVARSTRYAAQTRAVEAHSLVKRHPDEAAAIERFAQLSVAAQLQLAREVVTTRAAELTLAYSNLAMVTVGFRSRRGARGVHEVHDEVCILFVVKRKWRKPPRGVQGQVLPRHLLTYGELAGQRVLVAVPSDVQPARWFVGAVARGASAVDVVDPQYPAPGTIACGVRLDGGASAGGMALSALHVLSPVAVINKVAPGGPLTLRSVGSGAAIGSSLPWGGRLSATGMSFDAQLASIDDDAWRHSAFAGLVLSATRPYVVNEKMFDAMTATQRFQILAPANHPKRLASPRDPMIAQFVAYAFDELPIDYPVRTSAGATVAPIRHRELLMLRVLEDCPAPEPGDSGSAVVTWWPDGSVTLVGMFIASPDDEATARVAYVLPAWHLFNLNNWDALPSGTTRMAPTF
jgi:hypothetical protein